MNPKFYARPESEPRRLNLSPRLASWNAAGDPDQRRLADALADAEDLVRQELSAIPGEAALRLDVGLPTGVDLLRERDLDNYLYPLARHLTRRNGASLRSVWGTKQLADASYLRLEPAVTVEPVEPAEPPPWAGIFQVRTTASSETAAYKQQIHDQLRDAGAALIPGGPVRLQLAFVVGPGRNWLNLWKPAIDALDLLLGRTVSGRPWHPRDGRIVELGLHCTVDDAARWDVVIAIAALPAR